MALDIVQMTLGPAQTNTYIVAPKGSHEAVVVDPSWDGQLILEEAKKRASQRWEQADNDNATGENGKDTP